MEIEAGCGVSVIDVVFVMYPKPFNVSEFHLPIPQK